MGVYNENRDKNQSMHDEIREQNAKLKNASVKEKLLYFKDYYMKGTIIGIIVLIVVINIIHTIVSAPKFTAFGALLYNTGGSFTDSSLLADDFAEYQQLDTVNGEVYIDGTYVYSTDPEKMNEMVYLGIQKSQAMISAKDVDIITGDSVAFDYFANSECFLDVTTVLAPEVLERFKDQIYYVTLAETGETLPLGIIVTGAPKLTENYYYVGREAILGFVANSQNIDTAKAFLEYIYIE